MLSLISKYGDSTSREKRASDIVPVSIDCTAWLNSLPKDPSSSTVETISGAAWTANNGVTVSNQTVTSPIVYAQLEAGTAGGIATVEIEITTSAGNIETCSYDVKIV